MLWKCNSCKKTDGVRNGYCLKDGPVQTTPMDDEAYKEAKVNLGVGSKEKKLEK